VQWRFMANTDTTPSTEWALSCLTHEKCGFIFELLNRDTDRAHRLFFFGFGTDTIPKASAVAKTDAFMFDWTEGKYFHRFTLDKPATFDDFNSTASIKPDRSWDPTGHIMSIGSLTKIKIPQVYMDFEPFNWLWDMVGITRIQYGNGQRTKPLIYAPYYPNAKPSGLMSIASG
jgi:hypothetical protein